MGQANVSGPRIREAREKLGLGQVDLSAALNLNFQINLTQSDISEIERQQRGLRDFELDAIARVLEVSPEWLLRGDSSTTHDR
jgi:transcriptional regulator with XRE-family HTH domain